jgi:acetolactate decarboxylase
LDTVTQYAPLDALLAGSYDGFVTGAEVLSQGTFGLGTFDRLDGEMVVIDKALYQVKADGKVYQPSPDIRVPFACVCQFQWDTALTVDRRAGMKAIEDLIQKTVGNSNALCAIRIEGRFLDVKTRSVPAQKKPYPPLVKVTPHQSVFQMQDVSGTIVGFWFPPYARGLNMPGAHLHFLTENRQAGGHVLDYLLQEGTVYIDVCTRYTVVLPESGVLQAVDLSVDRTADMHQAER